MSNCITFERDPQVSEFLDDIDYTLANSNDAAFYDMAMTAWDTVCEEFGISALQRGNGDDYDIFISALNGEIVHEDDILAVCSEYFGRSTIGAIQSLIDDINAEHAARLGFAG